MVEPIGPKIPSLPPEQGKASIEKLAENVKRDLGTLTSSLKDFMQNSHLVDQRESLEKFVAVILKSNDSSQQAAALPGE